MKRKDFLKIIGILPAGTAAMGLGSLKLLNDSLPKSEKMPVLFIGHGSPMNGIQDTEFSQGWSNMAKKISEPKVVLVVSAHWETRGTYITAMEHPRTIHDFGGFPQALYDVQYPAPGNPDFAKETANMIKSVNVGLDHDWGLDHGTWTVVRHMYPDANIPVLQLSIDFTKPAQFHHDLGSQLQALRHKGVLIIGSGNMVHNLRMVAWDKIRTNEDYGYDWALQMNDKFKELISSGDNKSMINYQTIGREALLAVPTPEHYYPLLYTLGLRTPKDDVMFFNDKPVGGSLTMTSVKIG